MRIRKPPNPFESDFLKGGSGSGNFGHAGRPGEVGGSAADGGAGSAKSALRAGARAVLEKYKGITPDVLRSPMVTGPMRAELEKEFKKQALENGIASEKELEQWRLAQFNWKSSSDGPMSDAIEYVARAKYDGTVYSRGEDKTFDFAHRVSVLEEAERLGLSSGTIDKLMEAEQIFHQEIIRSYYGEEVSVYRGVYFNPQRPDPYGFSAGRHDVKLNALSSWSLSKDTAAAFAHPGFRGTGYVFEAKVHVERIFSSALGGFGSTGEEEVLLFGKTGLSVNVIPMRG